MSTSDSILQELFEEQNSTAMRNNNSSTKTKNQQVLGFPFDKDDSIRPFVIVRQPPTKTEKVVAIINTVLNVIGVLAILGCFVATAYIAFQISDVYETVRIISKQ